MGTSLRIYVNEQPYDVEPGLRFIDLAESVVPGLSQELRDNTAHLTDGTGCPVLATEKIKAGMIIRVVKSSLTEMRESSA